MLKRTITYPDYNGGTRTEDFYFNLTQAEITEMELSVDGGLVEMINRIVAARTADRSSPRSRTSFCGLTAKSPPTASGLSRARSFGTPSPRPRPTASFSWSSPLTPMRRPLSSTALSPPRAPHPLLLLPPCPLPDAVREIGDAGNHSTCDGDRGAIQ